MWGIRVSDPTSGSSASAPGVGFRIAAVSYRTTSRQLSVRARWESGIEAAQCPPRAQHTIFVRHRQLDREITDGTRLTRQNHPHCFSSSGRTAAEPRPWAIWPEVRRILHVPQPPPRQPNITLAPDLRIAASTVSSGPQATVPPTGLSVIVYNHARQVPRPTTSRTALSLSSGGPLSPRTDRDSRDHVDQDAALEQEPSSSRLSASRAIAKNRSAA